MPRIRDLLARVLRALRLIPAPPPDTAVLHEQLAAARARIVHLEQLRDWLTEMVQDARRERDAAHLTLIVASVNGLLFRHNRGRA
jgi:hypothetical protein